MGPVVSEPRLLGRLMFASSAWIDKCWQLLLRSVWIQELGPILGGSLS